MTYLTRFIFSFSSAVFLLPLLAGSCGSSPGVCPCPTGGATIQLPGDIANVSAPAPCTASAFATNVVLVGRDGAGSCQVRIELTNGATYTSLVRFNGGGGCCPYTNYGYAGPLIPIDGGSGD